MVVGEEQEGRSWICTMQSHRGKYIMLIVLMPGVSNGVHKLNLSIANTIGSRKKCPLLRGVRYKEVRNIRV